MRPGSVPGPVYRAPVLILALSLLLLPRAESLLGQVRVEPPDTIPVDSTRLRIQQQLEGLAKPPGVDSTFFLPDSLLPDSIREIKEAREAGRRFGGGRESSGGSGSGMTEGDSIIMVLKDLEGYSLTEYQALGADFLAAERRLILKGSPETRAHILADGQALIADSLFFNEETGKVWSTGESATFQPSEGEPVNSRIIVFDLNEERGTALDATTRYSGGGEWIVHGDLTSVSDTASFGSHLAFTSCEHEEPHYHFSSNNVKIVRGNLLVARPVKLYFADVPVAWLPFIVQNLERGRSSGILTPIFSINDIVRTSSNYSRRVSNIGFYWAMSDYYDTTWSLDWWSGEHKALTGSFRFDWAKQFLNGNLNFRRFWRDNGDKEAAVSGQTAWEVSERTRLRVRGSYATSTSMVRETSFDPQEVVQSIDSEGGVQHRFDFGNLTLSANRKQYLTDDRVEMTLPNLSFSLSPQTFLKASPAQARFFNNMTWSASAGIRRNTSDRPEQPDSVPFNSSQADKQKTSARFTTSLNLGNLSFGGGVTYAEDLVKDVPIGMPLIGPLGPEVPYSVQDSAKADAGWNISLGYQQQLVGSTTLTPSMSLSSQLIRSDRDSLTNSFVAGPTRFSMGVNLRTEIYGFLPGFGSFEAIRHKITPSFNFSYAPEVTPTELQRQVFGTTDARPQKTLQISLTQTLEGKREVDPGAALPPGSPLPGGDPTDSLQAVPMDPAAMAGDSLGVDSLAADSLRADSGQGAQSQQEAQKITLLALKSTAITYDFDEAEERGDWLWGVTNTVITNTISSDYLRGLNVTIAHDLFEDVLGTGGEGGEGGSSRRFAPHLSSLNFGFSMDGGSRPIALLMGLLGVGEEASDSVAGAAPVTPPGEVPDDPFTPTMNDGANVLPGGSDPSPRTRARTPGGGAGGAGWRANLRFSMQRPRSDTQPANQMLQGTLTFPLSENWSANWRTSYDFINGSFNDHYIQLTRNLHRWEAHFDFQKTATGNWRFKFEVSLTDQEDLHFDYSQRSYQDQSGFRRY